METILSKQEIDDLLEAIKAGHISLDNDAKDQVFKECSPLNLFQINAVNEELSRIPNFDIILDNFCQNYAITLTNQLQRTFTIHRTSLESAHFQDFLVENKDIGAIGVLDVSPLKNGALLLIDANMCFAVIETMLGASTELDNIQLDRTLTKIELSIFKYIIAKGCNDLNRAFTPLIDLNSSLLKVENNPRLVSITDPDAEVLVGTFEMSVGNMAGQMKIMFPLATLEPLRDDFRDLLNVNKSKQGLWTDIIKEEIEGIATEIIAQSGTITMSVNEILALQQGDVLPLDYNPNAPLKMLVGNQPKFRAIPGTHNGKKAVNITGTYE